VRARGAPRPRARRRTRAGAAPGVADAVCENEPPCVTEQELVDDLFSLVRCDSWRPKRAAGAADGAAAPR
jgi:hypothetical protein